MSGRLTAEREANWRELSTDGREVVTQSFARALQGGLRETFWEIDALREERDSLRAQLDVLRAAYRYVTSTHAKPYPSISPSAHEGERTRHRVDAMSIQTHTCPRCGGIAFSQKEKLCAPCMAEVLEGIVWPTKEAP